jgi:hypothetical protein
MQDPNPYAEQVTPALAVDESKRAAPHALIPPLQQSRLWLYVLSVTGLLCAGLLLLSMLGVLASMARYSGRAGIRANFAPILTVLMVYLPLLAVIVTPSVLLWRFARRIGRLLRQPNNGQLEATLTIQRNLWRWSGAVLVAVIGVYFLLFLFLAAADFSV